MVRKVTERRPPAQEFYIRDIIATLELDPNVTHVAIRELCGNLGLEAGPQERRVRAHPVLAEGTRRMEVDLEDYQGPALCLRLDLVPLWLAGLDGALVRPDIRPRLELFQRESASLLWQSFKPQGFGSDDALLPDRHQQSPAELAYVSEIGTANLARQQMLIERQLVASRTARELTGEDPAAEDLGADPQAALLAQTVRRVALTLAERTRRNEYGGVFSGLFRQFGIGSYRRMPPARLREALEWLERWHGDILGEPEPPPDI